MVPGLISLEFPSYEKVRLGYGMVWGGGWGGGGSVYVHRGKRTKSRKTKGCFQCALCMLSCIFLLILGNKQLIDDVNG